MFCKSQVVDENIIIVNAMAMKHFKFYERKGPLYFVLDTRQPQGSK